MTAISPPTPRAHVDYAALSTEELDVRVHERFLKIFKELCVNYETRKELVWLSRDVLNKGIWDTPEYKKILEKQPNATTRLKWIKDNKIAEGGWADPNLFVRGEEGQNFSVKPEIPVAEAIRNIAKNKLYLTDGRSVVNLARLQVLLEVLGDERMNRLFKKRVILGMEHNNEVDRFFRFTRGATEASHKAIDLVKNSQPLARLLELKTDYDETTILPGRICTFKGATLFYAAQHIAYSCQGHYSVKDTDDLFWTFGLGKEPKKRTDLDSRLLEPYRDEPVTNHGFDPCSTIEFDAGVIHRLLQHPPEEATIELLEECGGITDLVKPARPDDRSP